MAAFPHLDLLSDTELLLSLCSEENDHELYEEFVKRFLPELTDQCHKICNRRKLDLQIGSQIAHECFEKVRKYKSFKADEIKLRDSRKAVLAYLFKVAVNLFNDHQRATDRKESLDVNKTYFGNLLEDREEKYPPEKLKELKEKALAAFKTLNSREQKVITTDLEHKRSQKYLPDEVIALLATEIGVKKDTIRKIRERAIVKIKNAINEV